MKVPVYISLLFLLAGFSAHAQSSDSTIARYARNFGQERVYLQYDKSSYAPGETVWFKAYLMQGVAPADDSRTLYVDWTDETGKLLLHHVSPIAEATSNGQFDVPREYKGQFVHVKAYTKWMLNFDTAFLYEKDIRIINKTLIAAANKTLPAITLQFFPEGGDIAAGVRNKIAFKSNDQWGRPARIKGFVENNKGELLDSLRILHDGMGYFFLSPLAGETYVAKWKDEKGTSYTTPLPAVNSAAVALQVTIAGTKRQFAVSAEPGLAKAIGTVRIIGTLNQYQVFNITRDISPGAASVSIPTQSLPSGILTITVFDNQLKPLAERITYINNDEFRFKADLTVEHWGLNKRARNEILLTVPDSLVANFAVSVTDAGIEADSSDNIISRLLLTGDLKGQVYNAAYYFSANTDTIAQRLDLVMLTHGWRRFDWAAVAKNKFPAIHFQRDTSFLTLSGKVYGATPAQLNEGVITMVINQKGVTDGNKMILLGLEPDGSFNEPTYFLFDTAHVFFQLSKNLGDASVIFMGDRLPARSRIAASGYFYNQVGDTIGAARHFQLSEEILRLLKETEGKTLENVILKTKAKTPMEVMDEKYTSGLFEGGDNYRFDLVNDKTAFPTTNIFQYLQAKVAGLQISASPPAMRWRGAAPQLFVDEIEMNPQFVSSISVAQVAYIKVFRPGSFVGTGITSNGAVAIYTRKGGDALEPGSRGLNTSTISGYTPVRQFYSPSYAGLNANDDKKDFRTTLYWNPEVVTTRVKNKVKLVFYNNDTSKAFRVVIEGMTKDGQLVRIEQMME
jgi:hypothetical protein